MTVFEMIRILTEFNPDMEVTFRNVNDLGSDKEFVNAKFDNDKAVIELRKARE